MNLNCAWNGFDLSAQFTGGALFDVSLTGTYYNGYDDNTVWTQAFKEGANSPLYLVQNAYTVENPNGTFPRLTLGNQGHGGDNGLASLSGCVTVDTFVSNPHNWVTHSPRDG